MKKSNFFVQILLFAMFLLVSTNSFAQWARCFGGEAEDSPWCVLQTRDGNFAIVGRTRSFLEKTEDILFFTFDRNGSILTQKVFSGSMQDEPHTLLQTSNGMFIIGGNTSTFGEGSRDFLIMGLDENDNLLWQKTLGGYYDENFFSITQMNSSNVALAGWSFSFGSGRTDGIIAQLDGQGNLRWANAYGEELFDYFYSSADGGQNLLLVSGFTNSFSEGYDDDVWVLALDSNGKKIWEFTIGGEFDESARCIAKSTTGEYLLFGMTKSIVPERNLALLIKINSNGDVLWQKAYDFGSDVVIFSATEFANTEFVAVGGIMAQNNYYDFFVFEVNANGEILWAKGFGGEDTDLASSVAKGINNELFVAGWTFSFGKGISDILVLNLDGDGNLPDGAVTQYNVAVNEIETEFPKKIVDSKVTEISKELSDSYLQQHDANLIVTYLNPLSIPFAESKPEFYFYFENGNLVIKSFEAGFWEKFASQTIEIYSLLGQRIWSSGIENAQLNSQEIRIPLFPQGLHFVKIANLWVCPVLFR